MYTLPEVQKPFTDFVLRGESQNRILPFIKPNGLTPEQRLNVYRNNTQLGLTEALRDGFPVVNKLVGAEFFNHLARSYIRQHPPKEGCLLFFGGQFADFIADFKAAQGLPYLPDVAKLEWLWHEAFHEADAAALDIAMFSKVDPDAFGKLGFALHPSVRFLASNFPVLRIWQANQEDYEGDGHISLDEGGCQSLIYRPKLEVEIVALNEGEYLFLTLLEKEVTLSQALEQVTINNPSFDILAVLQRWFANGLFTEFYIKH